MITKSSLAVAVLLAVAACSSPENPAPPATTPTAPSPTGVERLVLNDVEDVRVEMSSPDALAAGFGSVWVKRDDGSVSRVAPSGTVQATIEAERFEPPVCQGIGVTANAVWACPTNGTIVRIDPRTDEVVATVEVPNLNEQVRLASSGDEVWVLTGDGDRLTAIAEATNEPGRSIELGEFCTEVSERAVGSVLWVTCASAGSLLRVDVAKGEVAGTVTDLPLATNVSAADFVWVGFEGGLAQIDPESLEVRMVHDVRPSPGGAVRATEDAVWVREDRDDFLARLDPDSGAVLQEVAAKGLPSGGDVLVLDGAVWASAYDDGTLVRLTPP